MMNIKTIYFDLDGVLADFERASFMKTGVVNPHESPELTDQWLKTLFEDPTFFLHLEKFYYADALIDFARTITDDIRILSATGSYQPKSVSDQKHLWCEANLPGIPVHLVMKGEDKKVFANESSLLIDDRPEVCKAFLMEGGEIIRHITYVETADKLNRYIT